MKVFIFPAVLLVLVSVTGCSAMLVPETNDPYEKIQWAYELFERQDRPLPAENLLLESIAICEENSDYECLGSAFVSYGFLLRSPSVEKAESSYRKYGFYDDEINYENRLFKSKEFFEIAIENLLKTDRYDLLTNAYLNLGFAYYFLEETENECDPYAKSLSFYEKNIKVNPDVNVAIPEGVSSFPEYVTLHQKRAGCD